MWGCDGPTEVPLFGIVCSSCAGFNYECTVCKGTGVEQIFECPNKQLDMEFQTLYRLYHLYSNGMLPVEGGTLDQSNFFIRVASIFEAEQNTWEHDRQQAQIRKSKAQARAKHGG